MGPSVNVEVIQSGERLQTIRTLVRFHVGMSFEVFPRYSGLGKAFPAILARERPFPRMDAHVRR